MDGNGDHENLFKGLAEAIQEHLDLKPQLDEGKVREIAVEEVVKARMPRPLAITVNDPPTAILPDRVHCQFQALMALIEEGAVNILMVGPAGSGKTTLGKDVAKASDLRFEFVSLSRGVTETHLFGRMLPKDDGTWGYVESSFVRIYRNGGVFLLDEFDAADENVLVSINAALANGQLSNPVTGEVIQRHLNCYTPDAANTWGRGGDQHPHLLPLRQRAPGGRPSQQHLPETWRGSTSAAKRELLDCLTLNRTLSDVSLCLTRRKPFDFLVERPFLRDGRGEWT
jgi:hypothetical protein